MRGLKILIAVMTFLIVIGLGLFGYGMMHIYKKSPLPASPTILDAIPVVSGGVVQSVSPYKESLAIAVTAPEGDYIYFYDPARRGVTHVLSLDNGGKK